MSTGTIRTLNPGVIDINPAEGGGAINFTETPPSNVVAGSSVSFDIVPDPNNARSQIAVNIALIISSTPPPPPLTTIIDSNTSGTPFVNTGETLIINAGITLTGSITLKGGTLNMAAGAVLTGDIIAIAGSTISLVNATVNGDVDVFDGASFAKVGGTHTGGINIKRTMTVNLSGGTHADDVIIRRTKQGVIIDGVTTTAKGDIRVRNSANVTVINNKVDGDLILIGNKPCSTASGGVPNSNTVVGKNKGCQ